MESSNFFSGTALLNLYPSSGSWVSGTFVNKNHFAGYLEMVIPLTLGMLWTQFTSSSSSRGKISIERFRETYPKALLLLLAIVFMIVCLTVKRFKRGNSQFFDRYRFFCFPGPAAPPSTETGRNHPVIYCCCYRCDDLLESCCAAKSIVYAQNPGKRYILPGS